MNQALIAAFTEPVGRNSVPAGSFDQYLPLFAMLVLGSLFAAGSFFASRLLAPRRPTEAKLAPYECGIVPHREPPQRFPVRFYLIALTFVILDVEIIFLFPYAVNAAQLGTFGIVEMVFFAVPVVITLAFLFSVGAMEWGTQKRAYRIEPSSTKSSVRRVSRNDFAQSQAGA